MNIEATQNTKAPVATQIMKDVGRGLPPSGEQLQAALDGPIENLEQHKRSPTVDQETKIASEHVQNILYTTKQMLVDNHLQDLFRQLVDEAAKFANDAKPVLEEATERVKDSNNDNLKRELYYLQQMGGELGSGFRTLLRSFLTDNDFRRASFDLVDHLASLFQVSQTRRDQSYYSSYQPDIDFLDESSTDYPSQTQTPLEQKVFTHPNVLPTENPSALPEPPQRTHFPTSTQPIVTTADQTQSNVAMRDVSDQDIDKLGEYIDIIIQKSGEEQALGRALSSLVSIYQHLQHQYYETTHHTASGPKDPTYEKLEQLRHNTHYNASKLYLRLLLEHFAGGKSLEGFIHALKDFIRLTANDEKLRHLQNRLYDAFDEIQRSSNQKGTEYRQKITDIIKEARHLLYGDERYRYATARMFREAQEFFRAIKRDPTNRQVAEAWKNLAGDIFEDEQHTKLSSRGLQALENVFRHLLLTEFQYVPLPRIEFSNEDMSAILDDMVVASSEILPDKIIFRASTTNQLAAHEENRSENLLEVYLEQVRFIMEDFYFWFDRKSFPAITDEGRADLAVLDQGVKMHLVLRFVASEQRANEPGKGPFHLEVKRANISIDNLRLKVREAKNHQFLLKMITPFVKGNIRARMQEGLQSSIRGLVDRLNMYLDSQNPDYMSNVVKQYLF